MPKSKYVDFAAIKAAVTMEQVLARYGVLDTFKRGKDSLSGPCPIHKGSNPTQFRVSLSKNVWNCFSECKHGGNVIDFIRRMENISFHAAATKAIEWFNLDRATVFTDRKPEEEPSDETPAHAHTSRPKPAPQPAKPEDNAPNKPLKFRLDKLQKEHPYLIKERDLTLETIVDFGIGYCQKGLMEGRIAIPIHNPAGEVVAYVGRFPGAPAEDTPKYKLPPGFRKSQELFNIDRAIKEPANKPLLIVEGYFDCMKVHQNGWRKVVALMGSTLSLAQEELLKQHLKENCQVIVMLDEDQAGREGRDDIAARLARHCFVKVHTFETEGIQPDNLIAEDLQQILEGVQ